MRRQLFVFFLCPTVEIGRVPIRIRVFAFPSARASRLMIFQSECGCSSFSQPDRRNWSCSNENTAVRFSLRPSVEVDDFSVRIRLFAVASTRTLRLVMFQSEYGCSPFSPPDRLDQRCMNRNTTARLSLPRASRLMLLNQNTAVRRFLDPKVDIGDVSIRIQLFAFPSARGLRTMIC